MLQKLVMHSRAIAHHQELRCCSLAKTSMTFLKVVKEYHYIINRCPEVLRSLPQVLDSMIMRDEMPYLDGVLVMQYQFRISDGYNGFVRQ